MISKPASKLSVGLVLIGLGALGFLASETVTALALGIPVTEFGGYNYAAGGAATHTMLANIVDLVSGLVGFAGMVIVIASLRSHAQRPRPQSRPG